MTGLAFLVIGPAVKPAHHRPVPGGETFFPLKMGRRAKKLFPKSFYRGLAFVALAVRGRKSAFKNTIFGHSSYHSGHILPVKSLVKPFNHDEGSCAHLVRFYRWHNPRRL